MKKNDRASLRGRSVAELKKLLQEASVDQARAKLELPLGKHSNVHAVSEIRNKRAVIKTILREKELEAAG